MTIYVLQGYDDGSFAAFARQKGVDSGPCNDTILFGAGGTIQGPNGDISAEAGNNMIDDVGSIPEIHDDPLYENMGNGAVWTGGLDDGTCGGAPYDLLCGEGDADPVFGLACNEDAHGGLGNDVLLVGTRDDVLQGCEGGDYPYGGAGDTLYRDDGPAVAWSIRDHDPVCNGEGIACIGDRGEECTTARNRIL